MEITASMVKELREATGAGILDCRKALVENDGDLQKALEYLQKKSLAKAEKKSGRIAAEGIVGHYIHAGGRIGVLCEVNSETDFVAKNEEFQGFVRDICMHIAAMNPTYLSQDEIPAADVEKQKEILTAQAKESGKPDAVIEKMIGGRLRKWFEEVCLLDQTYVKEDKKKVREVVTEAVARIGENIKIRRFVRWEVGEGLEKKQEDFAAEVAAAAGI